MQPWQIVVHYPHFHCPHLMWPLTIWPEGQTNATVSKDYYHKLFIHTCNYFQLLHGMWLCCFYNHVVAAQCISQFCTFGTLAGILLWAAVIYINIVVFKIHPLSAMQEVWFTSTCMWACHECIRFICFAHSVFMLCIMYKNSDNQFTKAQGLYTHPRGIWDESLANISWLGVCCWPLIHYSSLWISLWQ